MTLTEDANGSSIQGRPAKRQRASRKGQPRCFSCPYEACDKVYSRAEHLARHELNHAPKKVFRCENVGCGDTFVRSDLFARHKRKHHEKSTAETEGRSPRATEPGCGALVVSQVNQPAPLPSPVVTAYGGDPGLGMQTVSPLPEISSSWMPDLRGSITTANARHDVSVAAMPPQVSREEDMSMAGAQGLDAYMQSDQVNFANWLLDPPDSQIGNQELPEFPFLDYSLEYSPTDIWGLEHFFNPSNLEDRNQQCMPSAFSQQRDSIRFDAHVTITEACRLSIVNTLRSFLTKKRPPALRTTCERSLLSTTDDCLSARITTEIVQRYLTVFWRDVAKQMPIVHQPTFDANTCQHYLLLAVLALGAAQLVRLGSKGTLDDHKDLADLIVINLRWEILIDDDAQPPMQLWAAQALLLLEFYEKMYSTRSLHERAHIYHASTITLLRRGSPLVARDGSETPQSGMPTRCGTPDGGTGNHNGQVDDKDTRYWRRWSRIESMNRVVFAAFQMDALHAVLFGHESALFPYEIRLALPCDEILWNATSPDEVQRLEESFSMHGIRPINFLDGLKRCLHGHVVQSHHQGRHILMSGLLSVSWHLYKRDKHIQSLETVPVAQEQERWGTLLHEAFSSWRRSFDQALSGSKPYRSGKGRLAGGESEPTVLFHLANITARVDIIDLQILAGSKRLLGRKVSSREHTRVVYRMRQWAGSAASRSAVLHAFQLVNETFLPASTFTAAGAPNASLHSAYSCRSDPSIYRPWVLYLAGLTIWAWQYGNAQTLQASPSSARVDDMHEVALKYISSCAILQKAERLPLVTSSHGCCALLQLLSEDFAIAEPELLVEASKRLRQCQVLLSGVMTPA